MDGCQHSAWLLTSRSSFHRVSGMQIGSPVCVVDNKLAPAAAQTHYCSRTAVTQAGDSCSSLAAAYQTTAVRLQQINAGLDCSNPSAPLATLQSLCVSAVSANTTSDLTNSNNPAR